MNNKYKVIIKGDEFNFSVKTKGNINSIVVAMMETVCDIVRENGVSKKDFVEKCKRTYELCVEEEEKMKNYD